MRAKYDQAQNRSSAGHGVQLGVISAILLLVIALMLWNTSGLKKALKASTEQYVTDVSDQLASDISSRFHIYQMTLAALSEELSSFSGPDETQQLLERQADILDFDALFIIEKNKLTDLPDLGEVDLQSVPGIKDAFAGQQTVTYIEDRQNLLFLTPIEQDGQIDSVLAGVRSKENMQQLIQPKSFSGHGLTCIIDGTGKVVLSPTDLKPFLQLDSVFKEGEDLAAEQAIAQMQQNIAQQQAGVFQFTATDDSQLVLSYRPLYVNDWLLLTLVPAGLISGSADAYMLRAFLIVGGIVAVLTVFLLLQLRYYRTSRKYLEQVAFTDQLTGGMNQAAFRLAYEKLISLGMDPGAYTVIFLNVRGFKLINENFGVEAGNDTLRHIYVSLKRHIQADEIAARGAADQFFLCLHTGDKETIQKRLDQLMADINSFSQHTDIRYYLTILQGACVVEDPAADVTIWQDRARMACKLQGEKGKCAFYSAEMLEQMKKEQELGALFEASLKNHDFQVYLQPKVRLTDGRLAGAEALVRWVHPQRGTIFPSDFIPLFEKTGDICKLDLYVFEEVCILLDRWRREGRELVPISVNMSRAHFKNLNFLRPFTALKERYHIPDTMIEIELTESTFFDEQQRKLVQNSVEEMHRNGFLCSLDDFGVGFSSLALLKEFDVDTIKLDRQFFDDIASEKAQKVIASFVQLAAKLHIHTVAEGIETQSQLAFLRAVGCDMIQGYVFSKPLSISDFERWAPPAIEG
ncbi:GGDEF domain-containing protein [Neobittarella massiliensis]|uniref:GGDEF domain-containing protein n=1 Tax=Neobittarella massiliensis (ex Bilen et al. 2018) TaxID=2041842 RepID=A0A8J6IM77_9FIRM|nr:GGDEF domain-containing protein [Neobittarella massiliensis]